MTFRPMLAATLEDPSSLRFPVLVSPKLDGLRCIIRGGRAVSRSLKPFRNQYVQEVMGRHAELEGLDGELIVGEPNVGHVLNRTQSGIMSADGRPEFKFYIFDNINAEHEPFQVRYDSLYKFKHSHIEVVRHIAIHSAQELLKYESIVLRNGYEGIIIRGIMSPYKFGRATESEHSLFKFKRFRDGEAVVTGLEEGVINMNTAELDNLGLSKRSLHVANMLPAKRVGTILATDLVTGEQMNISPGRMNYQMRQFYWEHPQQLIGQIIKYKTFDYGSLDASRFSTFQAIRSAEDMS
jgi:DNA ligase-1